MRLIKRTFKDNLFTFLFSEPKYILRLYQALHPEDKVTTEADIDNVTISNVLTNDFYNDLGFTVKDRLIVLVEAQSSWSFNIVIRSLIYLMMSYKDYAINNKINLYGSRKAELPKPELYVIYTGERKDRHETISLSRDIFNCEKGECCIDAEIKVIYDSAKGDIINQYKGFITVFKRQIKIDGYTQKALAETIKICKNKDILKEFLSKHEQEVITMYDFLFDQEFVTEMYHKELEEDARNEGRNEGIEQAIKCVINTNKKLGYSTSEIIDYIMNCFGLSKEKATQAVTNE